LNPFWLPEQFLFVQATCKGFNYPINKNFEDKGRKNRMRNTDKI